MRFAQAAIGAVFAAIGLWGVLGEPRGREGPTVGRTLRVVSALVLAVGVIVVVGAFR